MRTIVLAAFVAVIGSASSATAAPPSRYAETASQAAEANPLDGYALDDVPRTANPRGKFVCDESDLVSYRGTTLKLHKSVRVHRAFVARLIMFEEIVRDVATKVYGRPPKTLQHLGAYVCRRIRRIPTLLSEHALGDALDIEGFNFPAISKADKALAPKGLAGAFSVRVAKHWTATKGSGAVHARFLRELADALITRPDIFRVMLGPSYPGHQDHFHVDAANYRLVQL